MRRVTRYDRFHFPFRVRTMAEVDLISQRFHTHYVDCGA